MADNQLAKMIGYRLFLPRACLVRRLPDQARFSLVLYRGDHSIPLRND
jgi:hypothetical protein